MKNRKLLLIVSIVLALTMSLGGTLAYLTDTDEAVNVMTLGNVQIEQLELQRKDGVAHTGTLAKDELEEFKQGQPLYPAYPHNNAATDYSAEQADLLYWGSYVTAQGAGNGLWNDEKLSGALDKFVFVKNTGSSPAYYRTWLAFECPEGMEYSQGPDKEFMMNVNGHPFFDWEEVGYVTIKDVKYLVMCATYTEKLAAGEISRPSLLQVVMTHNATNEDMVLLGNSYEILVVTQAVQTTNFPDAKTALNAAFGVPSTTSHPWIDLDDPNNELDQEPDDIYIPAVKAGLSEAMTTLADGTDITKKVTNVIYGKNENYPEIVNGGYEHAIADEGVMAYYVADENGNYTVYMLSDDVIYAPADSRSLFQNMSNVTTIDTSNLDFSKVTNALGMFANCSNLETLDTANWDMSNVENMQSLFYGCNKLKDIDVSNWDTSSCTNMRMVFFRCYELDFDDTEHLDLTGWDVSKVKNFYSMFKHCRGLKTVNLTTWDTSSATNMSHMFANCGAIEELDLSSFNTSNVTDMSWMFYDASKMTAIYVGDGWDTSNVDPSTARPFYNNQALVGGEGTTWLNVCDMANANRPWESSAELKYAVVDGGAENPGLLTLKNN